MIRPFTLLTAALAIGSGYYLYQAKHRTKLLDEHIVSVEQKTAAAETRIAVLRAEWALENSPNRLADLAAHYLLLVPMQPSQAVSLVELAAHLPPPSESGVAPPTDAEPDLPALAGLPHPDIYASLAYFAPTSTEARPSVEPLVVTSVPAAPAAQAPAALETPALATRTRSSLATLPRAPTPEPASAETFSAKAAHPAVVAAAPKRLAPPHLRPAPVQTSALGGAYPDLPPPAPISGSH